MADRAAAPLIGVTGHVELGDETARWVLDRLTERLAGVETRPLQGISCLAKGADQLFAQVVVALHGALDVVLPADDYVDVVTRAGAGESFRTLIGQARTVQTMPFATSGRRAYLAASEAMLSRCDLLLAVWNGLPSRRLGDTADVVGRARARRIPVEVLWPLAATAAPTAAAPTAPARAATPAAARGRD